MQLQSPFHVTLLDAAGETSFACHDSTDAARWR